MPDRTTTYTLHSTLTLFALEITRQRDAVALARLAREAQLAAQVVHANVVAIADVDIASAGESSSSLTPTGFVAGTPMYMAPEPATDLAALAPSVDIFSFGVVAFLAVGTAALDRATDHRAPAGHSCWAATVDRR